MAFGGTVEVDYKHNYPATINHPDETALALSTAQAVAGNDKVDGEVRPTMIAEDFSYMLECRPGAFIFIGNGDTAALHSSAYDFNEEAIPHGISSWVQLVESASRG